MDLPSILHQCSIPGSLCDHDDAELQVSKIAYVVCSADENHRPILYASPEFVKRVGYCFEECQLSQCEMLVGAEKIRTSRDAVSSLAARTGLPRDLIASALQRMQGHMRSRLEEGLGRCVVLGRRRDGRSFPAAIAMRRMPGAEKAFLVVWQIDLSESVGVREVLQDAFVGDHCSLLRAHDSLVTAHERLLEHDSIVQTLREQATGEVLNSMRLLYLSESETSLVGEEGEDGRWHPSPAAADTVGAAMTCHLQSGMAIDTHLLEAAEMMASSLSTRDTLSTMAPEESDIPALAIQEDARSESSLQSGESSVKEAPAANCVQLLLSEGFRFGKVLGASPGTHFEVVSAADGQSHVAVKRISDKGATCNAAVRATLSHEFNILASLCHPNIIASIRFLEVATDFAVVMSFFPGRQLVQMLAGGLGLEQRQDVLHQVLLATTHMHERRIGHRDLTAENVLVDFGGPCNASVKLVGFSTAIADDGLDGGQSRTVDGVNQRILPPMPPTDFEGVLKCDVFAAGLLAVGLATGTSTFTSTVFRRGCLALPAALGPVMLQPAFLGLLERMLNPSAEARPSSSDACGALERAGPWFEGSWGAIVAERGASAA